MRAHLQESTSRIRSVIEIENTGNGVIGLTVGRIKEKERRGRGEGARGTLTVDICWFYSRAKSLADRCSQFRFGLRYSPWSHRRDLGSWYNSTATRHHPRRCTFRYHMHHKRAFARSMWLHNQLRTCSRGCEPLVVPTMNLQGTPCNRLFLKNPCTFRRRKEGMAHLLTHTHTHTRTHTHTSE